MKNTGVIRLLLIVVATLALGCAALAKTVKVIVSYGNRGSQGTYACFLYRNGGSWTWKYLANTGFASGSAQFNDLPAGTYQARIICVQDGATRWTNAVSLTWWWQTYAELRAYY